MDREAEQFHKNVRAGFHVLAKKEPRRILLIDASSSLESVERTVEQCVTSWLKRHRFPQPHRR
jgi:dTMP kinase